MGGNRLSPFQRFVLRRSTLKRNERLWNTIMLIAVVVFLANAAMKYYVYTQTKDQSTLILALFYVFSSLVFYIIMTYQKIIRNIYRKVDKEPRQVKRHGEAGAP
jgi:hypothetical protein